MKEGEEMINFLNKLADDYYKSILQELLEERKYERDRSKRICKNQGRGNT